MRSKLASLSPPLGHVYDRAQKREARGMFCIHYAVRMSNIATGHRTQGTIALLQLLAQADALEQR